MRVIKDYGVVIDHGSTVLKFLKTDEGVCLAGYKDGMRIREYPFTKDEIKQIYEILCKHLDYKPAKKESKTKTDKDEVVSWLVSTPAGDTNFKSALEKATAEQIDAAIKQVMTKGGRNKTKLTTLEGQKDRLKPKEESKKETKNESKYVPLNEEKRPKIIQFPKRNDDSITYAMCVEKLKKEMETFTDADSQYVLMGLDELLKVDSDFRRNFMREDKSYGKCMEFIAKAGRDGYCYKYGQAQWIDRDAGLALALNYYDNDEEAQKAEEEKKKKAEATKKKTSKKKKGA